VDFDFEAAGFWLAAVGFADAGFADAGFADAGLFPEPGIARIVLSEAVVAPVEEAAEAGV
jgi:hypothetical protein